MPGNTRRYHAPGRQARAGQTRARILAAANEEFGRRGFATTVREVAATAGVSRASVELLFGTKTALLEAVIDVALAGDDEPVPVLERPWARALQLLPPADFLNGAAAALAAGARRAAPALRALEEGATRDTALSDLVNRRSEQRTAMATWVVSGLTDRGALSADLSVGDALETVLVLIDPPLLRRLLVERGWPEERLAAWLGRSFRRLLLNDDLTSSFQG